jgi:hypothetical protein
LASLMVIKLFWISRLFSKMPSNGVKSYKNPNPKNHGNLQNESDGVRWPSCEGKILHFSNATLYLSFFLSIILMFMIGILESAWSFFMGSRCMLTKSYLLKLHENDLGFRDLETKKQKGVILKEFGNPIIWSLHHHVCEFFWKKQIVAHMQVSLCVLVCFYWL